VHGVRHGFALVWKLRGLRACAALVARIDRGPLKRNLDVWESGTSKLRPVGRLFLFAKLAQNAFQRLDDFVALDTALPKLSFRLNCLDGGRYAKT